MQQERIRVKEVFISGDQALEIAKAEIEQAEAQRDSTVASWSDTCLGQPVLVSEWLDL